MPIKQTMKNINTYTTHTVKKGNNNNLTTQF